MKTDKRTTLNVAIGIALTAILVIGTGCNKTKDTDLTNIPSERRDKSQAVLITDIQYDHDVVLKDRVNGVDYLIANNLQINANLTIEPGVTLMFKDEAGIQVNEEGSLTAIGESSNLIYFTSEAGVRGSWKGITILSNHAKNVISYCRVEQAGGDNDYGKADIVVGSYSNTGQTEISNSEITTSLTTGILLSEGSRLIYFTGNKLFTNTTCPIEAYVGDAGQVSNSNTFSNNGLEYIRLTGKEDEVFTDPITLSKLTEPYLISGHIHLGNSFTIAPGTRLYMDEEAQILVDGTVGDASFSAIGTKTQPILIAPLYSGQGTWNSICFLSSSSPKNVIEYCNISGGGSLDNTNPGKGMLNMLSANGSTAIVMRNSNIMNSGAFGVYVQTAHCTYNNDIVSSNQFSNNVNGNIHFE